MGKEKGKVLVAMSGGVDSSTAAALLAEEGLEVVGVHLRLPVYGEPEAAGRTCCGLAGAEDARRVARRLGAPFYVLDYREKFERSVLENLRQEYRRARTPNPCVRCNEWVKFGFLVEAAEAVGARWIATGHYVRKSRAHDGRWELRQGLGEDDQSYFLFSLSQQQIERALFPLGGLTKRQVRAEARRLGLPVHDKASSQDLCFLAGGDYRELLREEWPELFRPGVIRHIRGREVGRHEGVASYTIGQRRGLRVAWREPLYVAALDPDRNQVVVGEREHLMRRQMTVGQVSWLSIAHAAASFRAGVRIRHRHGPAPGRVEPMDDGRVKVTFEEPQFAITPGQAAVFYAEETVLGGGFIEG